MESTPDGLVSHLDEMKTREELVEYLKKLHVQRSLVMQKTNSLYLGVSSTPVVAIGILGAVGSLFGGLYAMRKNRSHELQNKFMWGRVGFQSIAYIAIGWSAYKLQEAVNNAPGETPENEEYPIQAKERELRMLRQQATMLRMRLEEQNAKKDDL